MKVKHGKLLLLNTSARVHYLISEISFLQDTCNSCTTGMRADMYAWWPEG